VLALGSPLPLAVSSLFTASETLTWKSGLTLFGADVDRDRANPRAMYHYGNEVRARVGCARALPYFERAAALDPAYARALHNVTGCLIDLRRYRDARAASEAAYRLSPDDPGVVYNLAVVSLALGDAARARSLIDRALSLDPKHTAASALRRSLAP
jgi:tetratricopeptide (TPR) repeat protein